MKALKVIGFRHKTGELSVFKEYPDILKSELGYSYIVCLVKQTETENKVLFGGKPRRLYVFENEHPEIFINLENVKNIEEEEILISGQIVTLNVKPYTIDNRVYTHKTIAVICNDENELMAKTEKALKWQEMRL